MSSSFEWMPNGGAPLLPKVSPYCVPVKMMELKRRPTIYDIRGSAWQMRHYKAPIDAEVPWERVHFWPSKDVHVITEQEVIQPPMPKMTRTRTRTVAQKGPKVVKAPSTPVRAKKVAPKFAARYDYWRVFNYFHKLVFGAQGAVAAATADAADVVSTTAPVTDLPTLPGAIPDDDAAAADVDAQTESAADDEAQPSLLAAIFKLGVDFVLGQRKRAHEDDDTDAVASGDAKRRRVGSDAQAPSCAEARPAAGNAACNTTTGTTVPRYHVLTAVAAQRRDRRKPKPSRALCPPPTDDSAAGEGNTKVATARPIAGRPTRKRADTPDPRVGTPPPSQREASPAPSTPTRSPSSSRASTPERERSSSPSPSPSPSPAPKSGKSKSKSKSSSSKSTLSSSKSKSTSSSKGKSSSDSELSSSKSKSSSKPKTSSDKSKSSSSGSNSSSASKSSSSKSQSSASKAQASSSKTQASSSNTQAPTSKSQRSSTKAVVDTGSRPRPRSGTEIMLYPHFIYWNRDDKLANPWDPRCAAAPDPRFPWAPSSDYWANARTAPIAPLPEPPTPPSFRLERAPANPLYPSRRDRHRSPSPVREREREAERGELSGAETEQLSGAETEVESGGEETDCEE